LAKKNHDEGIAGVRKVSSTISRSHLWYQCLIVVA
jgi:hypothetical protein